MAIVTFGSMGTGTGYNNNLLGVADLFDYDFLSHSTTFLRLFDNASNYSLFNGTGFSFVFSGGQLVDVLSGTMTSYSLVIGGQSIITISGASVSAPALFDAAVASNTQLAFSLVFGGHDTMTGTAFADVIFGYGGNDVINGLGGADNMQGGNGSDTYHANLVTDQAVETNAVLATGGNDLVLFSGTTGTYVLGANVERLTLTGTAAISGTGNALANTIIGNGAANTINGGGGVDNMQGGNGSDIYYANLATDIVVEANAILATGGNDLVYFAGTTGTFVLGANVERLVLTGVAAINGTGNALANTIVGNSGSNVIAGGLGNDILTGGLGNDFFVFNTAPNSTTNRDAITDFNVAADTIRLENAVFTALGLATGTLASTMFKNLTTGGAVDANDRILYNDTTGQLFYDPDGSGAAAAVQFATLSGAPTVFFSDFVVI